jgi:hypothetical protein
MVKATGKVGGEEARTNRKALAEEVGIAGGGDPGKAEGLQLRRREAEMRGRGRRRVAAMEIRGRRGCGGRDPKEEGTQRGYRERQQRS